MRGITLTQPWATLVALGAKHVETRSWRTQYRGEVAIHAAKGFPEIAREECWAPAFRQVLEPAKVFVDYGSYSQLTPLAEVRYGMMPRGMVVAIAQLVDVVPAEPHALVISPTERAFGNYAVGRWAWLLDDVWPLLRPVPCRGALSLWPVPADVRQAIQAARA